MINRVSLTLCLLIVFSWVGYAQTEDSSDRVKNLEILPQLQQIYKVVSENLLSLKAGPCSLQTQTSVESNLDEARFYNEQGSRKCAEDIFLSLFKHENELAANNKARLYVAFAEFLNSRQLYDSAKTIARIAIALAEKKNLSEEKGRALIVLSYATQIQGNISLAMPLADSALNYARKTGNKKIEARSLLQIGFCSRRYFTATSNRTVGYYLQALEIAEHEDDTATIFTCNAYLFSDYGQSGRMWQGISNFENSVQIAITTHNVFQAYVVILNLAITLEEYGKMNEAEILLRAVSKLAQEQNLPYNEEHSYLQLAGYFETLQRYDSTIYYANLAQNAPGVDSNFANMYAFKARVYKEMGDYKNAAANYEKGIDQISSSFKLNNQQQLNAMEAQLHTKEKELEIVKKEDARKTLLRTILGLILLLVVIAWAFYVQRRARRRLAQQNEVIGRQAIKLQQSLGEKEMLLREVHHRVKNNLSVISGLLELQNDRIEDENIKAAFNEAQMRVRSVAIIHQNLYQHDNLANIELSAFFRDLGKQLHDVFGSGKRVKVFINMAPTYMDIDTAVPLGLMVNELMTNSYKYAFAGTDSPEISLGISDDGKGYHTLTYNDNGCGLPGGIKLENPSTLGLRLVSRLSVQLNGTAAYQFNRGAEFTLRFMDAVTRKQSE